VYGIIELRILSRQRPLTGNGEPNQYVQVGGLSSYSFRFRQIVDLRGGDASLLTAIFHNYPRLNGIVFDLAHVAEKATSRIDEVELSNRCQVIAGAVFALLPGAGDAYILSRMFLAGMMRGPSRF
jgi:hypothetical protein